MTSKLCKIYVRYAIYNLYVRNYTISISETVYCKLYVRNYLTLELNVKNYTHFILLLEFILHITWVTSEKCVRNCSKLECGSENMQHFSCMLVQKLCARNSAVFDDVLCAFVKHKHCHILFIMIVHFTAHEFCFKFTSIL